MSEFDPRSLWQDQPLDALPPEPNRASTAPQLDFAAPTASFGAARPQVKVWRVVTIGAALAAMVAVIIGIAVTPPPPRPQPATSSDDLLAECRVWGSPATGQPDWDRAMKACDRLLKLEPGNQEAMAQRAHLTELRACEANLNQARAFVTARREEEALLAYERLTGACEEYFFQAKVPARALALEVKRRAVGDCRKFAGEKQWSAALPRCELAAHLSCQLVDPTELAGQAEIRTFLEVREQLQPGALSWKCDEVEVLRRVAPPPDPAAIALNELSKRSPVPEFGRALTSYFKGDFHSASVPLEKLLEDASRSEHFEAARTLLFEIKEAISLYERAMAELNGGSFEKLVSLSHQALAVDERLILGAEAAGMSTEEKRRALDLRASFLRKSVRESVSSEAYERGKRLADRKDFRSSCREWKLGLSFARTNIDLLKALTNVCTPRAADDLAHAQTCEQLKAVLDFAVEGDGFAEKSVEAAEAKGCPPL